MHLGRTSPSEEFQPKRVKMVTAQRLPMFREGPSGPEIRYPNTAIGQSLVVQSDGSIAPGKDAGPVRPVDFLAVRAVTLPTLQSTDCDLGGATLSLGNTVLLSRQTDPSENGVYRIGAANALTRVDWLASDAQVRPMTLVIANGYWAKESWSVSGTTLANAYYVPINSDAVIVHAIGGGADDTPTINQLLAFEYGGQGLERIIRMVDALYIAKTNVWLQSAPNAGTVFNTVRIELDHEWNQQMTVTPGGGGPNHVISGYPTIALEATMPSGGALDATTIVVSDTTGIDNTYSVVLEDVAPNDLLLFYNIKSIDHGTNTVTLLEPLQAAVSVNCKAKFFKSQMGFDLDGKGTGHFTGIGDRFIEICRAQNCRIRNVTFFPQGNTFGASYDLGGRNNVYENVHTSNRDGTVVVGCAFEGQINGHGYGCVCEGATFDGLMFAGSVDCHWHECESNNAAGNGFGARGAFGGGTNGTYNCTLEKCKAQNCQVSFQARDGSHDLEVELEQVDCIDGVSHPGAGSGSTAPPYDISYTLISERCTHIVSEGIATTGMRIHSTSTGTKGNAFILSGNWEFDNLSGEETALGSSAFFFSLGGTPQVTIKSGSLTFGSSAGTAYWFAADGGSNIIVEDFRLTQTTGTAALGFVVPGAPVRMVLRNMTMGGAWSAWSLDTHGTIRQYNCTLIGTITGQQNVGQATLNGATPVNVPFEDMKANDWPNVQIASLLGTSHSYAVAVNAGVGFTLTGTAGNTDVVRYLI